MKFRILTFRQNFQQFFLILAAMHERVKKTFLSSFSSNSAIKETLKGQVNTFPNYLLFFAIRNEKTTTFIF